MVFFFFEKSCSPHYNCSLPLRARTMICIDIHKSKQHEYNKMSHNIHFKKQQLYPLHANIRTKICEHDSPHSSLYDMVSLSMNKRAYLIA